jgi:hypothetical protein
VWTIFSGENAAAAAAAALAAAGLLFSLCCVVSLIIFANPQTTIPQNFQQVVPFATMYKSEMYNRDRVFWSN